MLRELSSEEIGRRVKAVRRASLMTQAGLAAEMGAEQFRVSWLERGTAKTIDQRRLVQVATAAAGKGHLKKSAPEAVMDYLEGRVDELPIYMS